MRELPFVRIRCVEQQSAASARVVIMAVFLSYAHEDAERVDDLRRDLEDLVGQVWLDRSLTGGQLWWDEILVQLRGCRIVVLAVSQDSLRS